MPNFLKGNYELGSPESGSPAPEVRPPAETAMALNAFTRWPLSMNHAPGWGDSPLIELRTSADDLVKSILSFEPGETPYADVAARLGMTEGAVKTAVHRMRRRYGELLRAEIAETVVDTAEVDEEIRHLFQAVG